MTHSVDTYGACGKCGCELGGEAALVAIDKAWCHPCADKASPIRRRIVTEEGCATCAELARGSFGPPHDASPRCESGKRPHCTCDICF